MKKIKFLGKEYDWKTFKYDVDIFDLSDDELDEYLYLCPQTKFIFDGETCCGEGRTIKSGYEKIIDRRYLDDDEIEILDELGETR